MVIMPQLYIVGAQMKAWEHYIATGVLIITLYKEVLVFESEMK